MQEPGRICIALGFGFFISLAITSWGLRGLGALFPDLSNASVLYIGFLVLALLSLAYIYHRPLTHPANPSGRPSAITLPPSVQIGLLLLILLHLSYSFLEIITQPVFPWDGWTVWIFRAKAWFYSNNLAPILNFNQWFWGDEGGSYTTAAQLYPWMVSVIALWAAIGLGQWHEALVNMPSLLAAVAIGIGLFGLLRALNASKALLLIGAYLLVSTPIFSVHMSLGGYADIWLCGFAGLGMAAVLSGLVSSNNPTILLGLVMLLLGVGVKAEGVIWLTMAIAIIAVTRVPLRIWVLLLSFTAAALGMAYWAGVTTLAIPGMGLLGWSDGALVLPIKGLVYLQPNNVWSAYGRNALVLGSWNLLWPAMAAVLFLLAINRRSQPVTRVAWIFTSFFIGLQVLIFGFTTEGAWARDFTAINRVPLQLLPAFIFLIISGAESLLADRPLPDLGHLRRPLLIGTLTAASLTLLTLFFLLLGTSHGTQKAPMELTKKPLSYIHGNGAITPDTLAPDRFANGAAVVSSGAVSLATENYALLDLQLSYRPADQSPDRAPAFFWRQQGQPFKVNRVTLTQSGLIDLSQRRDWSGQVVEYGFFFTDEDPSVRISKARLLDPGPKDLLRLLPKQWLTFEGWTQRSANWIAGGAPNALIPLTTLIIALTAALALSIWLFTGRKFGTPILLACLLWGWLVLDARWLAERSHQAQISWHSLRQENLEQRMAKGELGKNHEWLQALASDHLDTAPQRLLIVPDPEEHEYYALRAKYQLLPHSSAVVRWRMNKRRLAQVDYVLFLGDFDRSKEPGSLNAENSEAIRLAQQLKIPPSARQNLELLTAAPEGVLFRVKQP